MKLVNQVNQNSGKCEICKADLFGDIGLCGRCRAKEAAVKFLDACPKAGEGEPPIGLVERLAFAESVLREVLLANALALSFGVRGKAAKILGVSNFTLARDLIRYPALVARYPLQSRPRKPNKNKEL